MHAKAIWHDARALDSLRPMPSRTEGGLRPAAHPNCELMIENIERLEKSRGYARQIIQRTKKQIREGNIHGGFETNIIDYIARDELPSTPWIKGRAEDLLKRIRGIDESITFSAHREVFGHEAVQGKTHESLMAKAIAVGRKAHSGDTQATQKASELQARSKIQKALRRREILGLLREKQRLEADYYAFLGARLKGTRNAARG